jgi:hypothetical protein
MSRRRSVDCKDRWFAWACSTASAQAQAPVPGDPTRRGPPAELLGPDGSLDWTTIWRPRLTNGPLTGTYRTATDHNVRNGLTISRPDVAHLMQSVLQQPETVGHAVGVAY